MKSDHWFYAIFRDCPWLFFRLMGLTEAQAAEYRFDAIELKEVSLRLDGLFRPERNGEPYYFFEAQLYKDADFYRKWMVKMLLYNLQNRVEGDWRGLVLFGSRGHEPSVSHGIGEWLASGRVQRVFLDELPEYPDASIDVAVLKLAVTKADCLLDKARELAAVARKMSANVNDTKKLLGTIASFVIANFPKMTRMEIQAMLQLGDIRESTVFQEAKEEGKVEGKVVQLYATIALLFSKGRSIPEICDLLDVDDKTVKSALAAQRPSLQDSKSTQSLAD